MQMAVAVIQEFEATPENYEKVNEKIGDAAPEGLILHTVSDLGGDRWKLVDVWESAEAFQNFVQNKLIPAIAEVDPDAPQAPEPEILEIRDLQKA
jgi:quinol monooxygenase YgiN